MSISSVDDVQDEDVIEVSDTATTTELHILSVYITTKWRDRERIHQAYRMERDYFQCTCLCRRSVAKIPRKEHVCLICDNNEHLILCFRIITH